MAAGGPVPTVAGEMVRIMNELTFAKLRRANVLRSREVFHLFDDWSPCDWATAIAGEVGELCNLIKKTRRGEVVSRRRLEEELADAVIYLDLLAACLNIDLELSIVTKFNKVSRKRGSQTKL